MKHRIQKLLAQANLGSRRSTETLIEQGRVRVNGEVAKLGDKADPTTDVIEVDGERLTLSDRKLYIALYKPKQVLTTSEPHSGDERETVFDLVPYKDHLFSIGRLDADSEGLIVLTNDGDLTNKLSHPRYRHTKTYRVTVRGLPTAATVEEWQNGVYLEDEDHELGGRTAPCAVTVVQGGQAESILRIVMVEGKKRQIRRIAVKLGHPVTRLIRTHIGLLSVENMKPGEFRELNEDEVQMLSGRSPELKSFRVKQQQQREASGVKKRWDRSDTDRPRRPRRDEEESDRPRRSLVSDDTRPRRPARDEEARPRTFRRDDEPQGDSGSEDRPRRSRTAGDFMRAAEPEARAARRPPRRRSDEGGDERGGERPRRPRAEGSSSDRPYRLRTEESSERPSRPRSSASGEGNFRRREEGSDERPRRPRPEGGYRSRAEGGDARPYRPRGEGASRAEGGDRPRRPQGEGGFRSREGAAGEDRPRRPRAEGDSRPRREGSPSDRPRRPRPEGGSDRPPRREGEGERGSTFQRRESGSPDRPRRPRPEGAPRRRESGDSDRPPRPRSGASRSNDAGDRPRRPARPRSEGERGRPSGDSRPPRPSRPSSGDAEAPRRRRRDDEAEG